MSAKAKSLGPENYVHLHNHTQYSLLDGLTKVPDLIDFVNGSGMTAVAMTDHGTMSGAIEFYKEATSKNVKPIIGIETYVAARKHTDKDPQKDKNRFHLILLAMNNVGYQNLMRLSTIANLDGFYYYPRIDHELLETYNEGIICLSGCMGGEIGDSLKQDQYDKAKETAAWYKGIFGDRYYLEIQDHGHPLNPLHNKEQEEINNKVMTLGQELDIPVVVTCDAHYLKHEDQDAHEILLCVGTGSYLADEKRMSLKDYPLHVEDPNELIKRWEKDHPEVILNTKKIADRCSISIELGKILIPTFDVPKGETEKSYLHKLVYRGLSWRYGEVSENQASNLSVSEAKKKIPEQVLERAAYELSIIEEMNFCGYFLIIADFINWGKDNGIVFGPGRGSAAGSIIAYSLKITELDPLKYDLLFERFLNPDRISMPDIDIDIQDTRRDEVIQYCVQKYGKERVANIVTFGRMFARNAVRDVARVLEVPYAEADRLAKMIPAPVQGHHIPLPISLEREPDLKREYQTNPTSRKVLDQALRLEGTVRSHGIHAAGVVIAPDDIVKFAPLEMAQKGVVSTQYPMGPIEELGLLKMDFLGLSNLTIIKNATRIIKKVYKKDIDVNTIPLDDSKTFELFQNGDTTGVFQFESSGMKRYLKELRPTEFEDIVAMGALYRPGPMQFIDDFIARKHGLKKIVYPHPSMENALKNTYGTLVYQEQVMQISIEACGFTGGEADTLRKAIGKKKADLMAQMKDKMIEGGQRVSNIDKTTMEKFWKQLEDFAAYCFNKSHAACYGLISYWTAYLKAHYPAAFMAALMTSDYDDTDRLAIEIAECQHIGIEVLPPDINESFMEFAVVKQDNKKTAIRFGMNAIKNVGHNAVEEILRAREDGSFDGIEDFLGRVNSRLVNKKVLEALIKSGAFDRFTERSLFLHNINAALAYANKLQKERNSGQIDLFGNAQHDVQIRTTLSMEDPKVVYTLREQLLWERELLGLYLSQHPLSMFENFLSEQTMPINEFTPGHDGKSVTIGGAITEVREFTTKNGQKMAFVKLEDQYGEIELIVFPNSLQQTIGIWERDKVVIARGKISAKDKEGNLSDVIKLIVDDAREITPEQATNYQLTGKKVRIPKAKTSASMPINEAKESSVIEKVYIRLLNSNDQDKLLSLKSTIDNYQGETEVVLVLGDPENKQIIKLPNRINNHPDAIDRLTEVVGSQNIKVQ